MTRTLAATALAPLAVLPVLALMFGPWAMAHGGWRSLFGILTPAIVVAYPMVLLIGRRDWRSGVRGVQCGSGAGVSRHRRPA